MRKHKFTTDAEAFQASYVDWLKVHCWHIITGPSQLKEEIVDAFRTVGLLVLWAVLVLTFPISFPIVTHIARQNKRHEILLRYTPEQLERAGIKV